MSPATASGLVRGRPTGTHNEPDDCSDLLMKTWTTGTTDGADPATAEVLRVLYVAVTRASRLVALALSDSHPTPVRAFLPDWGIAHRALHASGEQTVLPL